LEYDRNRNESRLVSTLYTHKVVYVFILTYWVIRLNWVGTL
jgi:hypothetical protein